MYLHTLITLFPCKQLQTETHVGFSLQFPSVQFPCKQLQTETRMAVCIIIIITITTFRRKQTGLIADM